MIIFWFRRDLRLHDNTGLLQALKKSASDYPQQVLPIFIFDSNILSKLRHKTDRRVAFIHSQVAQLKKEIQALGSDLFVYHGTPEKIFQNLLQHPPIKPSSNKVTHIYANHDYEPYAQERDEKIAQLAPNFITTKDQVIFEKDEILKDDGTPYSIFTPYSKTWLRHLDIPSFLPSNEQATWLKNLLPVSANQIKPIIPLSDLGFTTPPSLNSKESEILSLNYTQIINTIKTYDETRDTPAKNTTQLGIHLRFGTVSVRQLVKVAHQHNAVFLSELIWREFFMMILHHHPRVVTEAFKPKYDRIVWRNDPEEFKRWCEGNTGLPLVDAGMRELNHTGFMHNRVRMITASFLTKNLLIDWRWGERYFAEQLNDFELSTNNGNWQWAAGTGCDAAPYFRVFNPDTQAKKFDPDYVYIKKWVPEYNKKNYQPMVDLKTSRVRAIETYKRYI